MQKTARWSGTASTSKHWRGSMAAKQESDPNGRDPKQGGAKLDAGKSPVWQGLLDYFPRACEAVALVSAGGAAKY
jgi:hypothetical protein